MYVHYKFTKSLGEPKATAYTNVVVGTVWIYIHRIHVSIMKRSDAITDYRNIGNLRISWTKYLHVRRYVSRPSITYFY